MKQYTEDQIRDAVGEVEAKQMEGFLFQEPVSERSRSRRSRSGNRSRSRNRSRSHRS